MAAIANKNAKDTAEYIKANYWKTNVLTWKVFPLIQIFTLKFLPPALWTPFFNLIGFIFGIVINVASNRPKAVGSK